MFELIARILSFFYDMIPSYGFAIAMLTLLVMIVFMPLTFKSTKSMIAMRRIQPELKALQAKHADDKETLNKEMMALYQERGVNPVGGCLPVLFQAPVFYVLFRVVQGITRRTSDVGFINGNATGYGGLAEANPGVEVTLPGSIETPKKNFNPQYLDDLTDSPLYQDLINSNEMLSWGIDLSQSASAVLTTSIPSAIPYLGMVIITGFLSWFQQKQIQGRMKTAEMNPQMQMITKVMPWFLPVFAFTMPAALVVYFIVSALFRVGQQAVITRRFYGDEDDELDGGLLDSDATTTNDALNERDDARAARAGTRAESADTGTAAAAASTGGILGTLMGNDTKPSTPSDRHGSRRPSTGAKSPKNRSRPPREAASPKTETKSAASMFAGGSSKNGDAKPESRWAKAKRTAAGDESSNSRSSTNGSSSRRRGRQEPENEPAPGKSSKRVTAKGDGKPHSQTRNNKKKRK